MRNGSQTELCGGSDSSSPQHELFARTSMCYAGTKGRRNEVCYGQKKIARERGHSKQPGLGQPTQGAAQSAARATRDAFVPAAAQAQQHTKGSLKSNDAAPSTAAFTSGREQRCPRQATPST